MVGAMPPGKVAAAGLGMATSDPATTLVVVVLVNAAGPAVPAAPGAGAVAVWAAPPDGGVAVAPAAGGKASLVTGPVKREVGPTAAAEPGPLLVGEKPEEGLPRAAKGAADPTLGAVPWGEGFGA